MKLHCYKYCHLYYHNYNCYIDYIPRFGSLSANNRKLHKFDMGKASNNKEFDLSKISFSSKNLEIFLF
jgi:hypothetical protein